MKKLIIALAAIAAVIGLASCEKDPSKAIIGTWEATTVEMTIEGMKMEMDIEEMGANISFTFKKDGTGIASFAEDGEKALFDILNYFSEIDVKWITVTHLLGIEGKRKDFVSKVKTFKTTSKEEKYRIDSIE